MSQKMCQQTIRLKRCNQSARTRRANHRIRSNWTVKKGLYTSVIGLLLILNAIYLFFWFFLLDIVDEPLDYGLRDSLFTACKVGDVDSLCDLLQLPREMAEQSASCPTDVSSPLLLLNKPIDSSGFTLLHVAAAAAQKAVVRLLLDAGADPACR